MVWVSILKDGELLHKQEYVWGTIGRQTVRKDYENLAWRDALDDGKVIKADRQKVKFVIDP